MKTNPDLNKKVQDALDSLDGIQRAEIQPFFYTRLRARMEKSPKTGWELISAILARPVVAIAAIVLVVVLNFFILIREEAPSSVASNGNIEQALSDNEYILASSSSFDYENLEQQ